MVCCNAGCNLPRLLRDYDPSESESFAKAVNVGFLQVQATPGQVTSALEMVSVDNGNPEFNCQTWVEAALRLFRTRNFLTNDSYTSGLDGMVDAIAEAEDEEA